MSGNLTEETITEEVQRTFDTSTDERFRQLFVSLVQHLHDFAREWRLTGDEWFAAIDLAKHARSGWTPKRSMAPPAAIVARVRKRNATFAAQRRGAVELAAARLAAS